MIRMEDEWKRDGEREMNEVVEGEPHKRTKCRGRQQKSPRSLARLVREEASSQQELGVRSRRHQDPWAKATKQVSE